MPLAFFRSPERLYRLAMWAVSLAFAGFLANLGGRLVADLPGVEQPPTRDAFVDSAALGRVQAEQRAASARLDSLATRRRATVPALETAEQQANGAKEQFDVWVATRSATTDPRQDPEVLRRTRAVEALQGAAQAARAADLAVAQATAAQQAAVDALAARESALWEAAERRRAPVLRRRELEVFGIRLAITLPFVVLAAWAVARRRQSTYWPLWRGVALFGVLVFFEELVPYLPSYGGYVRAVVGVVLSAVAGVWGIRQMQRYFARRAALAAAHAAAGPRASLQPDAALPKLRAGVCPACDRPLGGASEGPINYCGGCGLHVYAPCRRCAARVSTVLTFCPQCGASDPTGPADGAPGGAPAPSAPAAGGRVLVGAGAPAGGAAPGLAG